MRLFSALGAFALPGVAFAALADPFQLRLDPLERGLALGGVAFGFERVVAHDPPLPRLVTEADLLHTQVVAHGLVAALAGHGSVRVGGSVAHALAGDPVPTGATQILKVAVAGEAAVDDGHDPAEPPAAQPVFDLGQDLVVVGVAGPHPTPHRDPLPGDGHADHDLGEVRA